MPVKSPQLMAEARKWLYRIETQQDIERIWPAFDQWFEASEEHRAAYAEARRNWLRLTGASPEQIKRIRSDRKKLIGPIEIWDVDDGIDLSFLLAILMAILAVASGQAASLLRILSLVDPLH